MARIAQLFNLTIDALFGAPEKQETRNMPIRPLPAEGIHDPNDLCNGVYNQDPRLANLKWDDPRFQAALNYIERSAGAAITAWDSLVNPGANGAPDLRTSTLARFVKLGQFYDADVRQIYLTPYSVLVAIWEITSPKVPMPQMQPFVFEAETAGASPVGEEIKPPIRGWPTFKNTSANARVGDVYTDRSGDEWRCDRYFLSGFFGRPGIEYLYWEKKYDR
jgi:hypothetical protein